MDRCQRRTRAVRGGASCGREAVGEGGIRSVTIESVRTLAFFVLALRVLAQDSQLEHIRSVNLERAANLPNFVADEIAVRYRSPRVSPPQWRQVDTIESEIAVRGRGFTRRNTLVDGKPWNKQVLPGPVV